MNSVSTKSFERLLNDDLNLQTFHNTVPAGILVISFDDGRVVFSNRYFAESLGVGGDQLLGANWESFFYDKSERERLMVEFVEDDEVKDFELRLQSQNGDVVWGLASMSIISIEEEDLLLFAFTDVTRLKEAELNLATMNRELQDLNEVRNRFIGMAAYDLRNPISAIRGMSQLIYAADLGEKKRKEFIANITRISDQMLALLEDLLDVSSLASATFDLEPEAGNLAELVEERIELVRFSAVEKNITIVPNLADVPEISFDRARMAQVIDNLLTNAVKFSQADTKIDVRVEATDREIAVVVQDYGQGIQEDELDKVFAAFEKLSSKPTAGEKSTGLGLAIVKQIVEAHRGAISVESTPGEGATFTVRLPKT